MELFDNKAKERKTGLNGISPPRRLNNPIRMISKNEDQMKYDLQATSSVRWIIK